MDHRGATQGGRSEGVSGRRGVKGPRALQVQSHEDDKESERWDPERNGARSSSSSVRPSDGHGSAAAFTPSALGAERAPRCVAAAAARWRRRWMLRLHQNWTRSLYAQSVRGGVVVVASSVDYYVRRIH
ncbi:hypothetical protein C0Q70_15572 [Pomacea canaliculata]|uniref:Uncharacterized protein n=1 Tax=Pomacea canaliculata TaxID=400727 RepID=A0A2T7NV95_POMCA|nr:hypothetical protein C0Q70_15572 [Pomacea canaliculata]